MPDSSTPTPTFIGIHETSIDFTGGSITLTGTNLNAVTEILIGPADGPQGTSDLSVSPDNTQLTATFQVPQPPFFPSTEIGSQTVWYQAGGTKETTGKTINVVGPSITLMTPHHGPLSGGTNFQITGQVFDTGATVTIGGTGTTNIQVTTGTGKDGKPEMVLTGTTEQFGTDLAGKPQEVVLNYLGATTSPDQKFTVTDVQLSKVKPNKGWLGGGTQVTLTGSDFTREATLAIGKVKVDVTSVSADGTTIVGNTKAFPGSDLNKQLDVTVTDAGATATLQNAFTVENTQLDTLSPTQGMITGGKTFTLTGHGFTPHAMVYFGTIPATDIKVDGDNTITGTIPAGLAAGKVDVTVEVQGVKSNALQYKYELQSSIPLTFDLSAANLPEGTAVYAYIVGAISISKTETYFYRFNADGKPVPMTSTDNTQPANSFPGEKGLSKTAKDALKDNYNDDWADFAIPLTASTSINLAEINPTNLPLLGTGTTAFSGRIYLSVGVPPLPFTVNTDGADTVIGYTQPSNYGGPGAQCLFDWIEFSFDKLQNLNANTTMVDGFGLPLGLSVVPEQEGYDGVTEVGLKAGVTRSDMLTTFTGTYSDSLVTAPAVAAEAYPPAITSGGVTSLRAISPDTSSVHGVNSSLATYYDTEITSNYTTWQTTPLVTHDVNTGYYSAMATTAGELQFKPGNLATASDWDNGPSVAFSFSTQITSAEIWQCDGMLATGSKASKNAGKIIAAAFNRGIVSNNLSDTGDSNTGFYPPRGTWNKWAHVAHQNCLHGLAYGFAYDDVCDQNPSVSLEVPTSVKISLGAF